MHRSSAGIARITVAIGVVAALVAAGGVFLLTGGDGDTATALLLEPAASTGPDPFTESVVTDDAPGEAVGPGFAIPEADAGAVGTVTGDTPGLYGGTGRAGECDVEQMIEFLTTNEDKGRAWATVQGVSFEELPDYLHGLTPAVLTVDTRVTNHGFRDGRATPRQSVLEAGTAILVDGRGVPRARCECGNPLVAPEAVASARTIGEPWDNYEPEGVVQIQPAENEIGALEIVCADAPPGTPAPVEGVVRIYVGRWSDVPVPDGLEVRTNVARVTVLVDTSNVGVAGNIAFGPPSGGPATSEWAVVGNAVGDLGSGSPTEFPNGQLSEYDESPAGGTPASSENLALTVAVTDASASGSAANGMTFHATLALEHDVAEDGVIPSEFTDLLEDVPGLDVPASGAPSSDSSTGGVPVECVTDGGDDGAPAGNPVSTVGEFTDYPGNPPSAPSPNRVSLEFSANGGPVTGSSEWAVNAGGGQTTVTGEWTGSYDAATGELSGTAEITTTGPSGQVLGSGTAEWSATYDATTGAATGTLESDDGPWRFRVVA